MIRWLKLWTLAAFVGAATGVASYAFLRALRWATRTRLDHPDLVWLLPVAGLLIGLSYHVIGKAANAGTPLVVAAADDAAHPVSIPLRMAPLIFSSTTIGHLFGASVGREGAALQMAGAIADGTARRVGLTRKDRAIIVTASIAAGFGGTFGVPATGVVFAVTVAGVARWRRLVTVAATVIAAAASYGTVAILGWDHATYPHLQSVNWSVLLPAKLVAVGLLLGGLGRLYMSTLDRVRRAARVVAWPPLRPVLGGLATIGLMALLGRDYLGLSLPLADAAIAGVPTDWWDPLLKIGFTVLALGLGFHGGELVPLLVVGATASSVLGDAFGIPVAVAVAAGFGAVFFASAHAALAGIVVAVELFGWSAAAPALIVVAAARVVVSRRFLRGKALYDLGEHS